MSATAVWFCFTCMISVGLISVFSSHLYRKEAAVTAGLMALVSFAPGFIYGIGAAMVVPVHLDGLTLSALLVKNLLYCLSFYLRYESLRKFGPFVGALMLGTQPIAIFFFGWALLGEDISSTQAVCIVLVAIALLVLAKRGERAVEITLGDFAKYYLLPTLASTLAIVWDRYFLKGHMSTAEFFILDRILLVPALLMVLMFFSRTRIETAVLVRNWKLISLVGLLFTLSVYSYNSALEIEKAAVVGLFRNSAYPLAAFAGAFIFRRQTSVREWTSFLLIVAAVAVGAL